MNQVSPTQLKRFLKHLCIVANRYEQREHAHKSLQHHISKLKVSSEHAKELNKRVNDLLEHHAKVSVLGKKKKIPAIERTRLKLLEHKLERIEEENKELRKENKKLYSMVDSVRSAQKTIMQTKQKVDKRVKKIESSVDKAKRTALRNEIKLQISKIESEYKKLSKDKSVSAKKLHHIEVMLIKYKAKLKKIKM